MTLRMRQICLVARELGPVVKAFEGVLGLRVCYRDPGVAKYGLENALFATGHQFLEVVAPVTEGTAAGRFLDRRGGDGGYMVITQVDDLDARRRRCASLGVRIANEIRHDEYHELQLHPRDVGAAMLSFSHQAPVGSVADPWHPAGPSAGSGLASPTVDAMVAAELQGDDPEALAARWSGVTERPLGRDADGRPIIALDDATLRFVPARDGRGDGLAGLDLACRDRAGVLARARAQGLPAIGSDTVMVCGVRIRVAD